MASQEKITVHNLAGRYRQCAASHATFLCLQLADTNADLKNTSDDAIPNYLNSLKFKQIHTLTDTRLALGYSAFAIAGACFAWDYKFGFESTKYYTAAAVAIYALLNAVLTYWIAYVEKGVVYQGVAPNGDKVRLSFVQHSLLSPETDQLPVLDLDIHLDQEERPRLPREGVNNCQGRQDRDD